MLRQFLVSITTSNNGKQRKVRGFDNPIVLDPNNAIVPVFSLSQLHQTSKPGRSSRPCISHHPHQPRLQIKAIPHPSSPKTLHNTTMCLYVDSTCPACGIADSDLFKRCHDPKPGCKVHEEYDTNEWCPSCVFELTMKIAELGELGEEGIARERQEYMDRLQSCEGGWVVAGGEERGQEADGEEEGEGEEGSGEDGGGGIEKRK